jgi:DNA-binding MarR family transcriptional regulator
MSFLGPLPSHTLQRIARHCRPEDEPQITAVLKLAETAAALKVEFDRVLHEAGLTDRKFAAIVALYTFDPTPLTPNDLAFHIGVRRTAMGALLRQLTSARWIERTRSLQRRGATLITLSIRGRSSAGRVVRQFLEAASRLGRRFAGTEPAALAYISEALSARAISPSSLKTHAHNSP